MISIFKNARDPWSSYTHFIGALISIIGLFFTIFHCIINKTHLLYSLGGIIFNISLILLYSASCIYHYYNGDSYIKKRLRKLDHAMIYVLIVGTYTPVVLKYMDAPHSYMFLSILWIVAIIGILIKLFWVNAPRLLSTMIYLLLGWAIIFDMNSFLNIPFNCLFLIALGGIAYSIGAIIYIFKKPNISDSFSFHEIFHVFVMIGSLLHYISIYLFVL